MASSKILDLRNLLAERFGSPLLGRSTSIPTGIAALDEHGGLPQNAITEIVAPHVSSGSATIIAALLANACRQRQFLALVDGRDSFDAQPLGRAMLRSLLWVRCTNARHAVRAADLLLRDGNFPVVVLDLVLNAPAELRGIPAMTWYRLQRLVENVPTAFVVFTRHSMVASAQLKLALNNRWSLADIDGEGAVERLQVNVRRSHPHIVSLAS